jgi:hypothetical protein
VANGFGRSSEPLSELGRPLPGLRPCVVAAGGKDRACERLARVGAGPLAVSRSASAGSPWRYTTSARSMSAVQPKGLGEKRPTAPAEPEPGRIHVAAQHAAHARNLLKLEDQKIGRTARRIPTGSGARDDAEPPAVLR